MFGDYGYTLELLNKAINCGIINIDNVQLQIENMKKEKILAEHPYNINKTNVVSNGKTYERWITFVMKNGKRSQIKRKTKEAIEEYHIEFYTAEEQNKIVTFKDCYNEWTGFKKQIVSDNTIYRYNTDYNRFFKDTEFENMNIVIINEKDIILYLSNIVKDKKLYHRAFKTLCGYIKEIFEYAESNRIININPYIYVKPKLKLINKLCIVDVYKNSDERTISNNDIEILLDKFQSDYASKPEYITPYAVEFAILTGCRVGEISALRWQDIENGIITIRSSEKSHRTKGKPITYTIEGTKTGKERKIPVTSAMADLLARVEKAENNIGSKSEFVFSDKGGRIISANISNCIRKKCLQVGISQKSIHACRRTVNSTLRCLGMSPTVAASLMGHTEEVNENCYTYDISALDTKKNMLEKTNTLLLNAK